VTPEELRDLSDDEIAVEAMNPVGIESKNARVEMDRRLIVALKNSKRSADRAALVLIVLTVVLVVLTIVLIWQG
jgi:hypothetical protein